MSCKIYCFFKMMTTNFKYSGWFINIPGYSFLTNGFRSGNRRKLSESDKIRPGFIGIQSDPQIGIR